MILVTGGTGFLGSHLLEKLIENLGEDVGQKDGNQKNIRAIHRSTSNPDLMQRFPNVEWLECDVLDVIQLEKAMEGIRQVYHCAAVVSFDSKEKEMMHQINVEGTKNVVNASINANINKFIHVSSIAAIGRKSSQKKVSETNEWDSDLATSEYSKSKYAAEIEVWRGIAEGLNAAIVNPSIIMGEGDWNKGTARFFTRSYGNPKFYTEGVSGFVDVKDVARAMILLMESDISADRFILNAENLPYKTVFEWIAEALGKKPAPYKANAFLSAMAWRFEAFRSKLTNSRPLITKETAQSANSEYLFDNSKFLNAFSNFEFTSIKDTILRVSKKFLDEH